MADPITIEYEGADYESALVVMSPAVSGKLVTNPSAFDDYWGTVLGFGFRLGEDTDDKRFYRQMVMDVRLDDPIGDATEVRESYNLPTDPKTGGPLLNENGEPARPNANSKWGVQESQFDTSLGIPWEGEVRNVIGLHAHFTVKGTRLSRDDIAKGKRAPRGEPPYGRYIVEWDHYDNDVRARAKLAPITTTFKNVQESAIAPTAPDGSATLASTDPRLEVAKLAHGKMWIEVFSLIRREHPHLAQYADRDAFASMVKDGLLKEVTGPSGKVIFETL